MDANYFFQRMLIDGSKGPYSKNTNIGRSANAGNEVASLLKSRSSNLLANADIKYTNQLPQIMWANGVMPPEEVSKANVNISGALAYSTEALKGYDVNGDGTISVAEFAKDNSVPRGVNLLLSEEGVAKSNAKAKALDLNNDGKIDAGEFSAYTIYQDGVKHDVTGIAQVGFIYGTVYDKDKVDGEVTAEEAKMANKELETHPDYVKSQLQQIYQKNKIAETQETFKMPKKIKTPKRPPVQDFMQQLMQMLMKLLGFGGSNTGIQTPQYDNPINTLPVYLSNGSIGVQRDQYE